MIPENEPQTCAPMHPKINARNCTSQTLAGKDDKHLIQEQGKSRAGAELAGQLWLLLMQLQGKEQMDDNDKLQKTL